MTALIRIMRPIVLALAVVTLCAASGRAAPSEEAMQIAREVVKISGATVGYENVVKIVAERTKQVFIPQNPDLQKDIIEVTDAIEAKLEPRGKEIAEKLATAYAETFTIEELTAIRDFFSSPAGRKYAAEFPGLTKTSLDIVQAFGDSISQEMVKQLREEMEKRGHKL